MPFAELNVLKTHVYFFKPQFVIRGSWFVVRATDMV